MILLGWITFFSLSYTTSTSGSYTTNTRTSFNVNAFWTGGYESECRWYGKLMAAAEAPTLAPLSTVLALLFGVLAVGIKLRIVEDLQPRASEAFAEAGPLGQAKQPSVVSSQSL